MDGIPLWLNSLTKVTLAILTIGFFLPKFLSYFLIVCKFSIVKFCFEKDLMQEVLKICSCILCCLVI